MLQVRAHRHGSRAYGWRPTIRQLVLVLVAWAGATVFVLVVAAGTKVGPILFQLSERHGVHAGDLLVGTASYGAALLLTAWIVWPRRRKW
jgi:hypothetical protein